MADWKLWLERGLLAIVVAALFFAAGDWLVWRLHLAHGAGYGTVRVTQMVVAPLKGNKEEYYPDSTGDQTCTRAVLPWGGANACWWVERHRFVLER